MSAIGFNGFATWADVLAYAKTGGALYYHAPLNVSPIRVRYEARARTIRIFPPGCTGRGKARTSDPFNADKGHLDRFYTRTVQGWKLDANGAGVF